MKNVIYIEGSLCKNKQDVFTVFSEALDFPPYFSSNWDSFEEIIKDLELIDGYIVVILDWKKVLCNDQQSKSILKDILKTSNKSNACRFLKLKSI